MKSFIEKKINELELLSEPEKKIEEIEINNIKRRFIINPREDAEIELKKIKTFPDPKILFYFFLRFGYMYHHTIGNLMIEKVRKEDIKSFLTYLLLEYSIIDAKNFLIELKKYFEALIKNADSINISEIKDIQIEKIKFKEEKDYDFLYRRFYDSCLMELVYEISYEHNEKKKINTSSFKDFPKIKISKNDFSNILIGERLRVKDLYEFVSIELEHLNESEINNEIATIKNRDIKKRSETKAKNRIEWKLKQTDLIEFFEIMKLNNFISQNTYLNMNIIIRDCFITEYGKDYDNQNIAKTKNQKPKKSLNFNKLNKAISDFKNKIT